MAHTKNVGGGLGDDDRRPPPRLPIDPKGKATKKIASRKRKYPDAETARAAGVAEAIERVERGGARSGVIIADQPFSPEARARIERVERLPGGAPGTVMVAGRRHAIDESQPYGESQQQQPQPAEQAKEAEETEQAPSHSYAALVVPMF